MLKFKQMEEFWTFLFWWDGVLVSFFNVCCFYSSSQYCVWLVVGGYRCRGAVPEMPVIVHTSSKAEWDHSTVRSDHRDLSCPAERQPDALMKTTKIAFVNRAFNQLFKSCWSNFKFLIAWNRRKKEISMLPGKSSNPVVISFQTCGLNIT